MNLPENYENSMRELLGEEYDAYYKSLSEASFSGLRVNTMRISCDEFVQKSIIPLRKVPWIPNGYYIEQNNEDATRPARHPYYFAGLYYLQEPSAMTPASRLPIEEGDRVLDLCAAPGGKATELGSRLKGSGFLLANDISVSRAAALLKNLELAGVHNLFVTAENPVKLAEQYTAYFDKILVDAPCSGEGMFRRDPAMLSHWLENGGPEAYVPVQWEILESAWKMLKPGGMLLYSTCTFAEKENEEQIIRLLEMYDDAVSVPMEGYERFVSGFRGLSNAVRLFPHKLEGEGHFLALLRKDGGSIKALSVNDSSENSVCIKNKKRTKKNSGKNRQDKGRQTEEQFPEKTKLFKEQLPKEIGNFLNAFSFDFSEGYFWLDKGKLYYLGKDMEIQAHIRYIRTGLLIGTWSGKRFEPSQALAMAGFSDSYSERILLDADDPFVIKYLKGETLPSDLTGLSAPWQLVCVDGFPLGWAKKAGNNLKNKYNPGWRWQ